MPIQIDERTRLFAPPVSLETVPGAIVALDPEAPHWLACDERGLWLLQRFDGRTPFAAVVADYASTHALDVAKAWLQVETFARDAARTGFVTTGESVRPPYRGRSVYLSLDRLREFWIQVNDFCNLTCEHCLVSSGPDRAQGAESALVADAIDQAVGLGAERVFITGGEPLARPDIEDLARRVVERHGRELVIMTNGTLLRGERLAWLSSLGRRPDGDAGVLRLQVSLDGSTPAINDPIRGVGSFDRIVEGIGNAVRAGLSVTLTATVLRHNLEDLESIVRLAASLDVPNVHLLWPHRRGRIVEGPFADLPSAQAILQATRRAARAADEVGVTLDNREEFRLRLDGAPGVKHDLAGAAWDSLCLSTDGWIYPSASMAGVAALRCGDLASQSLDTIWRESPICASLRGATLDQKPLCRVCSLKFLCGGGDLEHGYWASHHEGNGTRPSFLGHDPYCDLYKGLAADALASLSSDGRATVQPRSGFDRPVVYRSMGEHTLHEDDAVVRTTHSACVLSAEVAEKSRHSVREFYGAAAEQPQADLCCPIRPDAHDLAHIPAEVVERFYGCGSPVTSAALAAGECMVDLGSGAGIDCFIAAKRVGPEGRVVGVDMTAQMLEVATECRPKVASALGYDVVEFRRGYLEEIPVETASADVVTSNCVINLSPDKPRVFREIWRILRNHGRTVLADIVSDRDVPPKMRLDGRLWGECISGALTEEAFLAALERAGFYGVSILAKTFWREVEDCRFYSVTVRGFKYEKSAGCTYVGQYAIYLGPMKATVDEEGHLFPRGTPVEVCTDTAAKLARPPYAGAFAIVDSPTGAGDLASAGDAPCAPGSGCC